MQLLQVLFHEDPAVFFLLFEVVAGVENATDDSRQRYGEENGHAAHQSLEDFHHDGFPV